MGCKKVLRLLVQQPL